MGERSGVCSKVKVSKCWRKLHPKKSMHQMPSKAGHRCIGRCCLTTQRLSFGCSSMAPTRILKTTKAGRQMTSLMTIGGNFTNDIGKMALKKTVCPNQIKHYL